MKVLLLNSGGKDSLATAILLHREHELHSLHVNLGHPVSRREEEVSAKIAAKYCVSHEVFRGGPRSYAKPGKLGRNVQPHKCFVLHAIAAMHAVQIGAEAVASGQKADAVSADFAARLAAAASISSGFAPVSFIFPLRCDGDLDAAHREVVAIVKDDPLWPETVHCLRDPPCGNCPDCGAHRRALGGFAP